MPACIRLTYTKMTSLTRAANEVISFLNRVMNYRLLKFYVSVCSFLQIRKIIGYNTNQW